MIVRKRRELLHVALAVLAAPALAAVDRKLPRVVIGGFTSREYWKKRFAEAGLHDGRNVELMLIPGREDSLAAAAETARQLVAPRPDAILVLGETVPLALQKITRTIPVVFYACGPDPVKLGLVESVRRPGGNITGSTILAVSTLGKAWEVLLEIRPHARSMGCILARGDLDLPSMPPIREAQAAAAKRLRLRHVEIVVDLDGPFSRVEKAVLASGAELLDIGHPQLPWTADLMKLLERRSIPAVWIAAGHVHAGGLMCLVGSLDEAVGAAVQIVARILKGEPPAEIPVYESRHVIVAVNLRTARAMGITLPPSVLLQANIVVDDEEKAR